MKNKSVNPVRPILECGAILSLLLATAYSFYSIFYYEEDAMQFKLGRNPIIIYAIAAIIMLASAIFAALWVKNEHFEMSDKPLENRWSVLPAMFTGFVLIACPIYNVINIFKGVYDAPSKTRIGMLAMSVFAGIYFIYTASLKPVRKTVKQKNLTTVLQCCVIAWAVFFLMSEYFDVSSPLTSPVRLSMQVTLVAIMLYFVTETRLDIPEMFQSKRYVFFAVCTMVMTSLTAISEIVLVFTGFRYATKNTLYCFALLGIAIYVFTRAWDEVYQD